MMNPTSGRVFPIVGGLALFLFLTMFGVRSVRAAVTEHLARTTLRLEVYDLSDAASESQPLYFASNVNGWNPRDPGSVLSQGDAWIDVLPDGAVQRVSKHGALDPKDGARRVSTWQLDIELDDAMPRILEFKFTRGSWERVEVDESFRDLSNRRLDLNEIRRQFARDDVDESLVTLNLKPVRGWADEREGEVSRVRQATVTGTLDFYQVRSPQLGNTRSVRVWTPPGYEQDPDARYPVLYMHDGQNVFDEATSFIGSEWGADETAVELIERGVIPPMIIVGIDNAGAKRSYEMIPFENPVEGSPEYEGGGADKYLDFITETVMAFVDDRYRTRTGPEDTSLGGSSLGGLVTMYAAIRHPGVFGRMICESPALGVGDGRMYELMESRDVWPQRMVIAVGTKESEDPERAGWWVEGVEKAEGILRAKGLDERRLLVVIDEGAIHNEGAWAERLSQTFQFLFAE